MPCPCSFVLGRVSPADPARTIINTVLYTGTTTRLGNDQSIVNIMENGAFAP